MTVRDTPRQRLSIVERHPQYDEIIRAMAANETDSSIGARIKPQLDRTTLWRFRKDKLQERLQRAAQGPATVVQALQEQGLLRDTGDISRAVKAVVAATSAVCGADPFVARIEAGYAARSRIKDLAEQKGDLKAWAAVDRNDITALELHARLERRLDAGAPTGTTTIAFITLPGGNAGVGQALDEAAIDTTAVEIDS
jgi:hypothetical protein